MKKTLTAVLASVMLLGACSEETKDTTETKVDTKASAETTVAVKQTIQGEDFDPMGGADGYANSGDNANSRYYKTPDFYNLKSDDQLTIIEQFKTFQQTTEWSCGPATALMVLNHFEKHTELTEMDIAIAMNAHTDLDVEGSLPGSANSYHEYGSNVAQLHNFFENLEGFEVVESSYRENYTEADLVPADGSATGANVGNLPETFTWNSLYSSENSLETEAWVSDAKDSYFVKWLTSHLDANRPIMVEWADWGGHWQSIIGYDNNGTPGIGDDVLIFADPYDSSDHAQDGYYTYPLERWFGMWNDRNIAPKPYQLQPYVIVDVVK